MRRQILESHAQRPNSMFGFFFDAQDSNKPAHLDKWRGTFDDIAMEVVVERSFVSGHPAPGCGIVIHRGGGKFLPIGAGFQTTFKSTKRGSTFTGILTAQVKNVDEHGNLSTLRTMDGDETRSGAFMIMPTEQPDYGGFPIRVTMPARTLLQK